MPDYTYCDEGALPAEPTRLASLAPNRFHKLCPGAHASSFGSGGATYKPFGRPRCGDGSNFSFFVSRPLKQYANDRKVLIEFQGGGACWDGDTCGTAEGYLTFPEYYDDFVGLSCSEIEYGAAVRGGNPLSLLCAKKVGDTDFREYNTVVVPYCTQDVHLGDAPDVSYDGNDVIQHVGAHNMVRTLDWVFRNFPRPTHVFLTGCSAGGTAVPVAYDLINKHYNGFGPRSVNINSIMDSSVYLTPSYFLQNGFPNWNPGTIMKKKLRFNYDKHMYKESYPDLVWSHVLKRGGNRDRWGFVTHSYDPVSLMFYQYMSGSGGDGENGGNGDDDLQSQWWSEISGSMDYAKKMHRNVDSYVIDGEGHCSFGLYYPLQVEGFEEWATPIVKEKLVVGNRQPSVAFFGLGLALGGALIFLTQRMKRKGGALIDDDDKASSGRLGESVATAAKRVHLGCLNPLLAKCETWPWTAGYLSMVSVYFLGMLITQGFTHPLDNPALGPSAVGLSVFGINNPALIIYRMEHFRLIASSFLCSGMTTYLLMVYALYKAGLETAMKEGGHPHWHFPVVAGLLSFGINLSYACIGNGASCSCLALALGLDSFSTVMHRRAEVSYPSRTCFATSLFILACTPIFPFDSLVALTSAVIIGILLGLAMFTIDPMRTTEQGDEYHNGVVESKISAVKPEHQVRWKFVQGMGVVYLLMYLLILFRVPSPDERNVHPYLTGCNFVYSDQIDDLVSSYANGEGGGGDRADRALEGGEEGGDWVNGDDMCAQLCVPHLIYRPALWGVQKFAPIPLGEGTCEENGYDTHVADHTIRQFTVVLEVLLYTSSDNDED